MLVEGRPSDPTVLHLWGLRGKSAQTCGFHGESETREILDAFAGPEPGKTFAACLMVSDRILELREFAHEHLLNRISADVTVDALTGLLCLEALQFVPVENLAQPKVHRFIEYCSKLPGSSEVATLLLERVRKTGKAQRIDGFV